MSEVDEFYQIVKYPLITEKSVLLVEKQNKITVIVDRKANKTLLKQLFKKKFGVPVKKVNIINTPDGRKKAIITFYNSEDAMKVATALGIL